MDLQNEFIGRWYSSSFVHFKDYVQQTLTFLQQLNNDSASTFQDILKQVHADKQYVNHALTFKTLYIIVFFT